MEEQTVRKTYKYKLKPTPEQERAMAFIVRRCRELYNAALQERSEAWSLGPLVGMVYTEEFRLHHNDIALGYLLTRLTEQTVPLSDQYELRMVELPAVATIATVVQVGGPDLIFAALGRIGRWIELNGYCLAGPYRELGLQLPMDGSSDEMVIEVQMPLELRRGTSLPTADGHPV